MISNLVGLLKKKKVLNILFILLAEEEVERKQTAGPLGLLGLDQALIFRPLEPYPMASGAHVSHLYLL